VIAIRHKRTRRTAILASCIATLLSNNVVRAQELLLIHSPSSCLAVARSRRSIKSSCRKRTEIRPLDARSSAGEGARVRGDEAHQPRAMWIRPSGVTLATAASGVDVRDFLNWGPAFVNSCHDECAGYVIPGTSSAAGSLLSPQDTGAAP
jgi:hypothetical protein